MFSVFLLIAGAFSAGRAFARAGGGGHYSGGGHFSTGGHGSGGGGGGDGLAYLIYYDIQFLIRYPAEAVPLNIIGAIILVSMYKQSNETYVHRTIVRGAEAQDYLSQARNFAALKARDPAFDPDVFVSRASSAFLVVQQAWSDQDLSAARPFVTDAVMERFSLQVAMQLDERMRNKMELVTVREARVLQVESDARFDTLHVYFRASAVDTDVSLDDGRVLSGSGAPEEFEEIWSFLRRPSAKTLSKPGLMEGFCPNCGAALKIADAAQCPACKSWVNSGEYDWVLAEITQACEWSAREPGLDIQGYGALAAKDPDLDVPFLEDRASAAFWRWQYAHWKRDPSVMRSLAEDGLVEAVAADVRGDKATFFRNAAVGGADVLAIETGGPFDRAHVLVKWSADVYQGPREGRPESLGNSVRQHVFMLERKAGVATDRAAGLSSLRCPQCGAPPTRRDAAACEYCRAPFNDGSRSWVAASIVPIALWSRPAVPSPAPASGPAEAAAAVPALSAASESEDAWAGAVSPMDALSVMAAVLAADGAPAEEQERHILAFASRQGVPEGRVQGLLQAARAGRVELPKPENRAQAMACLRGMVRLSLANGVLSRGEKRALLAFGSRIKLDSAQIKSVFQSEKEEAYRRAKAALRERKATAG